MGSFCDGTYCLRVGIQFYQDLALICFCTTSLGQRVLHRIIKSVEGVVNMCVISIYVVFDIVSFGQKGT